MRLLARPAALAAAITIVLADAARAQGAPSPLERRIDSVFSAFSRTSTPGCAVGVDRGSTPLVRRAYGMANLEANVPWTVGTISESGSTAKQFVAAGLVLLARDGVLSLDDDIAKWIPEVRGLGARITVRQLLSHTSGLPDRYTLHEAEGRPAGVVDHPNAEVLAIVAKLRDLNFAPGEDYLYSNTGYVVAVAVLERASGKSLQAFTEERIFRPLGMTDTRWREDHRTVVPRRAAPYAGSGANGFRNDHPFTRVFGSGGLLLTIEDYLKWAGAQQRRVEPWGAVADSLSGVIRLNEGTAIAYGLGVSTDTWRGVRRVSHTGSTGGYRAALYRFPDQAVSVALLCNVGSANPGALATSVATIVLGEALEPARTDSTPPFPLTPEALSALAGRYRSPRTHDVLVLRPREGALVDSMTGAPFVPRAADRFTVRGSGTELRVVSGAPGAAARALPAEAPLALRMTSPGARANDFVRVEAPDTTAAARAAIAGRYRSPELDVTLSLVARGDSLAVDGGWRGFTVLRPLYRDGFAMPGGEILEFTRDARGRVTGFTLWAGRVRHLRFERAPSR